LLVEYEFKNFGKSPAIIHRLAAELVHRDPRGTGAAGLALAPVDRAIIGANEDTGRQPAEIKDFSRAKWATVTSGETYIHFYGNVVYSDIFGDEWSFSFDWKYSPGLRRLLPDNQPRRKTKHYVLKADPLK